MLDPPDADAVARAFALGGGASDMTFAARGELGRVFRLETVAGVWAVKELFTSRAADEIAENLAFQLAVRAAGVPAPRPVVSVAGDAVVDVPSVAGTALAVRVYERVDLDGAAVVTPQQAGELLARIHSTAWPAAGEVDPWFAAPLGAPRWDELVAASSVAMAPWAHALEALVPQLVAAEEVIRAGACAATQTCHLDFNRDNVLCDTGGQPVVIDWENAGPAAPRQELASAIAEFANEQSAPAMWRAYVAGGGDDQPIDEAAFSLALAVQGHLLDFYARRWLANDAGSDDRARSEWRLGAMTARPLTRGSIDRLVRSLRT